MISLDQFILGGGWKIVFLFIVEDFLILRLGGVGPLFFFYCMSDNESQVYNIILGL